MSDETIRVRNALVEAIATQKLVNEKLEKAKADLALWKTRAEKVKQDEPAVSQEIEHRIRQLELTIAELEAELMAQGDLEKQLRATLLKLENSVALSPVPNISDSHAAEETIERMEKKIFEKEAIAELSDKSNDEKLAKKTADLALDQELEELKKKMKEKNQ